MFKLVSTTKYYLNAFSNGLTRDYKFDIGFPYVNLINNGGSAVTAWLCLNLATELLPEPKEALLQMQPERSILTY